MEFHIIDEGEGPAILFIHAGVADSRMWEDQIGLNGFRTIAFDKRGYGKTPGPRGPFSDTTDSLTVLDQAGVDSAVVVGCSMGAATALDLTLDHADRVERLVLVGGFPSGWMPPDGWEEVPLEAEAAKAEEAGDFERVVEIDYLMWLVGYGRSEDAINPEHKELFFDMDRTPVQTQAERMEHHQGFGRDHNARLKEISVPSLIVVGEHDEPLLVDAAHHMASELEAGPAIVIPDAAHLPSMEQPEAFNEALVSFLNG